MPDKRRQKHYSAGIVVRWRKGNRLEFEIIKSVKIRGANIGLELKQFPGGMEKSIDLGDPLATLRREIEEETSRRIIEGADTPLLLKLEVNGHEKFFYLVWKRDCRGPKRTKTISDTRSMLYPPEWVDFETLERVLCESQRPILPILKEFIQKLKEVSSSTPTSPRLIP